MPCKRGKDLVPFHRTCRGGTDRAKEYLGYEWSLIRRGSDRHLHSSSGSPANSSPSRSGRDSWETVWAVGWSGGRRLGPLDLLVVREARV